MIRNRAAIWVWFSSFCQSLRSSVYDRRFVRRGFGRIERADCGFAPQPRAPFIALKPRKLRDGCGIIRRCSGKKSKTGRSDPRTIPIVFAVVADPIGNGFAASLAHPGGNLTGFTNLDSAISGKWIQLLKEVAPRTERVALLFNSATAMPFQFLTPSFQAAASTFAVQVSEAPVQAKEEIEGVIAAQARSPGSGLIVMPDTFNVTNRDLIIAAAARYRVPAMYFNPTFFVRAGGLVGYSNDYAEESRRAAGYIDKILRGAKPADLPIQQPTKFEAHHQSEDRQGSRPRCARASPASRRRGD